MTTPLITCVTDDLIADLEREMRYANECGCPALVGASDIAAILAERAELKRDSERYRKIRVVTPYRFKKIQDASLTDGGDVLYFHTDRFDLYVDAIKGKSE